METAPTVFGTLPGRSGLFRTPKAVNTPGLAAQGPTGYCAAMSFLLRRIVRYAAQQIASNPQVREKAAEAARVVVGEAKQIARRKDKAWAAGRALRRAINKLRGDR